MTPDRLPKEVEAVLDMRDPGLLVGEFEAPLRQEVFHERLDFVLQQKPRRARDDEVIRIANQVDLALLASAARLAEAFRQQPLQPIQGPVRQNRRYYSSLRCPFRGGEQDMLLQVTCFQPLPKHLLVHEDVILQPSMTDAIEARFDVPLEGPARAVCVRAVWASQDLVT